MENGSNNAFNLKVDLKVKKNILILLETISVEKKTKAVHSVK
jgi:hypothetical protein